MFKTCNIFTLSLSLSLSSLSLSLSPSLSLPLSLPPSLSPSLPPSPLSLSYWKNTITNSDLAYNAKDMCQTKGTKSTWQK